MLRWTLLVQRCLLHLVISLENDVSIILQVVSLFQLQTKMRETQSSGGAAMTPQEIQEFFARQHQGNQSMHRQPSPQDMRNDSSFSGSGPGSQPTLHQRHS